MTRWPEDQWEGSEQRIRRKRTKPQGRRKLADLSAEFTGQYDEDVQDDVVKRLLDLGHITEVVSELKSGKEATAYVARGPKGSVLLKIYRDLQARSFKNDQIYHDGQVIVKHRDRRAIENRTRVGLEMLQAGWVQAEYAHLWHLWEAGLSVPEPLVGPHPYDYAATTPAVLMRLIGTEDDIAPRLSDAKLTAEEARSAWNQALDGMANMLRLGYAHGDYSTYNLLWWEQAVIIIDFPQLTTRQNPNFRDLLKRDAQSLATSFRKHGVVETGESTLREVQRRALGPAPEPRVILP